MDISKLHTKIASVVVEELIKSGQTRMSGNNVRVDTSAQKLAGVVESVLQEFIPLYQVSATVPINVVALSKPAEESNEDNLIKKAVKSVLHTINSESVYILESDNKDLPEGVAKEILVVAPVVRVKKLFGEIAPNSHIKQ